MDRFEVSKILTEIYAKYMHREPQYKPLFSIKGNKNQLLNFIKYLWKNHRKYYYQLAFANKKHNFKNAIHEYYGGRGYLPYFSDEPDYYYIYC